jgi:hypothetical protein
MNESFPFSDNEADEKLIEILKGYIVEKKMPIHTANRVLKYNLRDPLNFDLKRWEAFILTIHGEAV